MPIRHSIRGPSYQGYQEVVKAVYITLSNINGAPSISDIAAVCALDQDVQCFLSEGGKYEYALKGVLHEAERQSEIGDGEFNRNFGDDENFTVLPICDNDLAFSLVEARLGMGY